MAYRLEGSMLEVCSCHAICPCWIGQAPDGGYCEGTIAWHFDKGDIDGMDVSGLTIAIATHIPGVAVDGNWRVAVFVDDEATPEQEQAILNVYTGKMGGPVADLVQLIGEVVSVERAPIRFDVEKNKGSLRIGSDISGELQPFVGATGGLTTLHDAVFSVIPGAPAYVGTASSFKLKNDKVGIDIELQGRSSVQGAFLFEC